MSESEALRAIWELFGPCGTPPTPAVVVEAVRHQCKQMRALRGERSDLYVAIDVSGRFVLPAGREPTELERQLLTHFVHQMGELDDARGRVKYLRSVLMDLHSAIASGGGSERVMERARVALHPKDGPPAWME